MNKKLILLVAFIIIVFAGIKIFKKEKGIEKKQKKGHINIKKVENITVKLEPYGELNLFPETLTLYFSEPVPNTTGVFIEEKEIGNYIAVKPEIRAKGKWINSNTFSINILSPLIPDSKYKVTVKKIPLKTKTRYLLKTETFSFVTPEIKPLSVAAIDLKKGMATLKLRFNHAVELANIENLIEIKNKNNEVIKPAGIKYSIENQKVKRDTLLIKARLTGAGEYTLTTLKGIKTPERFETKRTFTLKFSAGFSSLPIIVKEVKVNDLGDLFSIDFNIATLKNRPVSIKMGGIKNFISISPETEFNVSTTKSHITFTGRFRPGKDYTVILFSGIQGTKGEVLKSDYRASVYIPNHSPKLMFLYKGRYFGTKGEWKFPIVAKRLKEVTFSLYLIPEKNITLWYSYTGGSIWDVESFGKVVKKDFKIKIPESSGGLYFLDLKKLISMPEKGVYVLKAKAYSKEMERNYKDNAKFTISNISIIAKWNKKDLNAWVVNSNNANPVEDANITVYDYSNIEKGHGRTNLKGYVRIPLKGDKDCYLITAKTERDWTYIKLDDSKLPASNFDITGQSPQRNYIPYMYFERDLLRPGETVHLGVILRKNKTYSPISIPLKIKVLDPSGKIVKELNGITDENGFAIFKLKTEKNAITGKYIFNLYIADKNVASSSVFIESFAPERMLLKASFPKEINLNKPFTIDVEAFYLFGAPAEGETLKGSITLEEKNLTIEGFKNFTFGPLPYYYQKNRIETSITPVKLNNNGKAKIKVAFNSLPEFYNPVQLQAYLEVSEAGSGRATKKVFTKTVYTKDYYIGLTCGASKVTANTPLKVKGIVVNNNKEIEKSVKKLKYRGYKVAYTYNYYYYNQFSWRKNSTLIPLTQEREVDVINGKFTINYTPVTSYDDLVIEVRGEKNFSQIFINGWSWFGSEEAETPETLIIQTDKIEYEIGETLIAKTPIPFEGKILWTVEADKLIHYKWQKAKGKFSEFHFTVPQGYPCVYISAFLIHTGDNYLVSRAYGIKRVRIAPAKLKLKLEINAPDTIKPDSEIKIRLKGNEQFEATISIVDQGVLQITNFKSPDPYRGILTPIALGLESADGLGWLMKKYLATGGGMAAQKKGFIQPQFTKVVSIWSGKLKSDSNGNLKYSVKIPQYNGKLRVMVCAVSPKRLGSISKYITVKSDLIVTPTIPRFLTVKDKLKIPVTLINTTDKVLKGSLNAKLKNADIERYNKAFSLNARGRTTIFIPVKAGDKPGRFEIEINAFANGERVYSEGFKIPLFPDTAKVIETETITVNSNRKNIANAFKRYNPLNYEGEIYISTIPGLTKLHLTKDIIGYPYGCIEQVSTKTLTIIKLNKLLPLIDKKITLEKYREYVRDGIGRILSMQTLSGGFAYWPGDSYPQEWASAYATLVLIEAKRAGFSVPETSINAALNYLESLENIPPLGYYVLSKYGRLQKHPALIQQIEEIAKKENISLTPLMWYTAALYNCGESGLAKSLYLKGLNLKPDKNQDLDYDFHTPIKAEAIRVFVGEEISYDSELISNLIDKLTEKLSVRPGPYYYTTQELGWSMLAIGRFAEKNLKDKNFNATLKIDGREIKGLFEKGVYKFTGYNLPEKTDIVVGCNKTPFYVEIVHRGYRKEIKQVEKSNGITIMETLLDFKTGEPVKTLKQGDIAVLEIKVKGKDTYPNCAIEIPLAGGLEAENPRLNSTSLPEWAYFETEFDYLDIRDEKIVAFTTITNNTKTIYLIVRGVTPGDFYLAPAFATVMYKPFINGRNKLRRITIKGADEN